MISVCLASLHARHAQIKQLAKIVKEINLQVKLGYANVKLINILIQQNKSVTNAINNAKNVLDLILQIVLNAKNQVTYQMVEIVFVLIIMKNNKKQDYV